MCIRDSAYSLQLYFDFSGYSLMGIGMGKMLGFDFPANFNYPYICLLYTSRCPQLPQYGLSAVFHALHLRFAPSLPAAGRKI